jgi:membrane associated rhomboid family serine protease
MEFSAWIFLGLWFAMQALSAYLSLGIGGDAGGVAFWAHVGGFLLGLIAAPVLRKR